MKKILVAFLLLNFASISAQSDLHKKAADSFMSDFNNGHYDAVFESFSPKMKRALPRESCHEFLLRVKKDIGNLLRLDLYGYEENRRKERVYYDGRFERETATVRITTNDTGQIIGLYIKKKPRI